MKKLIKHIKDLQALQIKSMQKGISFSVSTLNDIVSVFFHGNEIKGGELIDAKYSIGLNNSHEINAFKRKVSKILDNYSPV